MKNRFLLQKSFLVFALSLMGMSAFSQVSLNTIPYTDGNTYPFATSVSVAGGAVIALGNNSSYTGTDYWNLANYSGMSIKVTFPADANGTVQLRLIVVGNTAVQSVQKDVAAVPNTTVTTTFDFTADGAESHKLWGIKLGWGTSVTTAYNLTIDEVNVIPISTSVPSVKAHHDPDRLVKVYSITGKLIRSNIKQSEATLGLQDGLYIVDNKKVVVNN